MSLSPTKLKPKSKLKPKAKAKPKLKPKAKAKQSHDAADETDKDLIVAKALDRTTELAVEACSAASVKKGRWRADALQWPMMRRLSTSSWP